ISYRTDLPDCERTCTNRRPFLAIRATARKAKDNGGEGWIRTSVRLRGQIYSLLPLTTRPPLQVKAGAPHGGASVPCQRGLPAEAPDGAAAGAGEGNRTLVVSLEGFCSTIELHPLWASQRTRQMAVPPATVNQPPA